jgi:hypothetical protein
MRLWLALTLIGLSWIIAPIAWWRFRRWFLGPDGG